MIGYCCIACDMELDKDFEGFTCPACGGNLDIRYDYAALAPLMQASFDAERLLPVKSSPVPLSIGRTPLYLAERLGAAIDLPGLLLKDESLNPSASLKDRASALVVRRALDVGAATVAAASTGNAGSSLACIAAAMGLRAVVFVPASAPPAKLTQLLSFGATVLAVRGNYDAAFDLCLAASETFGWFNRSTGVNPFTREGKKTCAWEIWLDLGRAVPDRIVVPTGDGNILSGIWKGWRDLHELGLVDRLPKIDCAQAEGSAAICQTVERLRGLNSLPAWTDVDVDAVSATTVADSISVDRPRDGLAAVRAVIESEGATVTVSDDELLAAIPEMARATGVFAEPAAATAWAGIRRLREAGEIASNERVVCLVTGSGLKDIGSARKIAGDPLEIDPTLDAVRQVVTA